MGQSSANAPSESLLKPLKIIILGGGIAGLTTALSLTKFAPPTQPPPTITIYEIRPEPATIGGAVNLTPNALRLLSHLGALQEIQAKNYGIECEAVEVFDLYSGAKLAESSFRGPDGKGLGSPSFKALRITRGDALKGVLAAIEKKGNIKLICGKKTVGIEEDEHSVTLTFSDGEKVSADVLIGCDGIHSVTRLKHVDPSRAAMYSGICNAFGFAPRRLVSPSSSNDTPDTNTTTNNTKPETEPEYEKTHFETSGMNFGRRGILLTSFHSTPKTSIYVGALMQIPAPSLNSPHGWKALGSDAQRTRKEMLERYSGASNPLIEHVIQDAQDLYLWPVFTLSKGGKWCTERTILIGDAAHAMPPQGESTGIVFEDGVIFARCLGRWMERREEVFSTSSPSTSDSKEGVPPVKEAFDVYEGLRRARIDAAFEESKGVVRTVQEVGWLGHWIKTGVVPWFLWWTRGGREKHFVEDVTTCALGY